MGKPALPEEERKRPNDNSIRLNYPSRNIITQVNNVASWLGVKQQEYVKALIFEDLKKQPEKYKLTPKPKM